MQPITLLTPITTTDLPTAGTPVKYALMGGSISTIRGAASADLQWHGIMHKWLELTFTGCGGR